MKDGPLASIIIDNYNYDRFLKEAIDSALNQSYQNTEVVVVDDGSTGSSLEVFASFGERIFPVLKEIGGQASAFNAGFGVSRGEVICFLDADDVLLPTALSTAAPLLLEADVAKVHWPLWAVDAHGRRAGSVFPKQSGLLPEGDLRDDVISSGPDSHVYPPTSGNAWSRRFLRLVLPMPEAEYRVCADSYLLTLAPAVGLIRRVSQPQGCYRVHGANNTWRMALDERIKGDLERYDHRCRVLSEHLRSSGVEIDPGHWKKRNSYYLWMERLHRAT
jgi:glycosyltransferase involved in cell wall biosynthesis